MFGVSRLPISEDRSGGSLGDALLALSFLRVGVRRRASIEELSDHLRRDLGLEPRAPRPADLRDLRW